MTSLTEREIICILTKQFARQLRPLLGFNEDVSAIPLSSKTWIIVKTDMLVGSTDIPPGMTIQEAGRKAVVAAVSDFAAKGVQPTALMVSLGLPGPVARKTVQNIAFGLSQAAREYHCKIIGGENNQDDDIVIEVAGVWGAEPKKLGRRDRGQVG